MLFPNTVQSTLLDNQINLGLNISATQKRLVGNVSGCSRMDGGGCKHTPWPAPLLQEVRQGCTRVSEKVLIHTWTSAVGWDRTSSAEGASGVVAFYYSCTGLCKSRSHNAPRTIETMVAFKTRKETISKVEALFKCMWRCRCMLIPGWCAINPPATHLEVWQKLTQLNACVLRTLGGSGSHVGTYEQCRKSAAYKHPKYTPGICSVYLGEGPVCQVLWV